MQEFSKKELIVDTSAFISLEAIDLLNEVLKNFKIITTNSVVNELREFSRHKDKAGKIANKVLKNKSKFIIKNAEIIEEIIFLEKTDNELFNLALKEKFSLITDDHKLNHHSREKIEIYFSTFFLIVFTLAKILNKKEALNKLENLRSIRNRNRNIIYLTSKMSWKNYNAKKK
ncbi:hypothetical protein HYT56_04350 [Candidatus Woesearchaeota archaeon]|nr:hypothetical protein [Candidatus Woesearchaeota archaeon]